MKTKKSATAVDGTSPIYKCYPIRGSLIKSLTLLGYIRSTIKGTIPSGIRDFGRITINRKSKIRWGWYPLKSINTFSGPLSSQS